MAEKWAMDTNLLHVGWLKNGPWARDQGDSRETVMKLGRQQGTSFKHAQFLQLPVLLHLQVLQVLNKRLGWTGTLSMHLHVASRFRRYGMVNPILMSVFIIIMLHVPTQT